MAFRLQVLLLGLFLALPAFASDGSLYEKEHIRGFISFGFDYRGMSSEHIDYINRVLFGSGKGFIGKTYTPGENGEMKESLSFYPDAGLKQYDKFDDWYFGLHINVGAQYKQLLTWFDFNFMPTQVSEYKCSKADQKAEKCDAKTPGNFDIKWFAYGADWMWGWKLFGENSVINLIPAVGLGLNLLNIHFGGNYQVLSYQGKDEVQITDSQGNEGTGNRYYSSFAMTFNSELELRLNLDPISIGLYGGYRVIRYNQFRIKNIDYGSNDQNGDTWFLGARLTWTFLSPWQKKQRDKL